VQFYYTNVSVYISFALKAAQDQNQDFIFCPWGWQRRETSDITWTAAAQEHRRESTSGSVREAAAESTDTADIPSVW